MVRSTENSPLKPRKAPRQPRSQKTVEDLLEAAAQVLEKMGLEGFNTNAVAERAGVSIGSLYQYFPGKDALTVALMRREGDRFQAEASACLQKPDGAAALKSFSGACVRQQLLRPELARLLDVEQSRPALRDEVEGKSVLRGLLTEILQRSDLPPQEHPEIAAEDLLAIVRAMTDSAGERLESNLPSLTRRVEAAVFGYLANMKWHAS